MSRLLRGEWDNPDYQQKDEGNYQAYRHERYGVTEEFFQAYYAGVLFFTNILGNKEGRGTGYS